MIDGCICDDYRRVWHESEQLIAPGDEQAEGNLGNERKRNSSESGRSRESMRNRKRSSPGSSPRESGSDSSENWSGVADEDAYDSGRSQR